VSFKVEITEKATEFLLSLDIKMQAKVFRTIDLLGEFGYKLQEPHVKKLKGIEDLYELRIKSSSNICRLFYFFWKNKTYVITSGFIKKQDKIDPEEIKKAIKIMNQLRKVKD
jgi:phage-related protein